MRPFNLARNRILERRACRQYIDSRLRGMLLILIVVVIVAAASGQLRARIDSKADSTRRVLADIEGRCLRTAKETSHDEACLAQRRWLDQLAGDTRMWLDMLDSILECLPPDIWLAQVQTVSGGSVVLATGSAASYESLSAFTTRLRSESAFKDIRIQDSKVTGSGKSRHVEFAVELQTRKSGAQGTAQSSEVPNIGEMP